MLVFFYRAIVFFLPICYNRFMMSAISEKENRVIYFDRQILADLYICNIGHHDFRFMEGCRLKRKESEYTMHFILRGKGFYNFGGKTYDICAGDVFFCPPDVLFSYYPDVADPWEYVWFTFDGSGAEIMLRLAGLTFSAPVKRAVTNDSIIRCIDKVFSMAGKNANRNALSALSAFTEIISLLATDENIPILKGTSPDYVKRAKTCIENNYSDPEFKIEHVGKLLFLNHAYLCRLFVKETGVTMVGYLRECRLSEAKRLLSETDKTVREISLECGYGDYPHFCKTFLLATGLTPSGFREKYRNI